MPGSRGETALVVDNQSEPLIERLGSPSTGDWTLGWTAFLLPSRRIRGQRLLHAPLAALGSP
ncbi:MAG: hypothetical protein CVU63_18535 [Deltaproteobacteria bacterium HGW-Deltaproteobacteria-20]|nr:MAG: hypothetical protein CVU63_18535 [Deltaproteobacteria bacterium HGW-Deltaproteobacteria-20]